MRIGITVHAISSWLLPYTCAGSLPSSPGRFLNLTTAYASSAQTHTKIAAVTPITSVDSAAIAAAGVDAGAKMLVGLMILFCLIRVRRSCCYWPFVVQGACRRRMWRAERLVKKTREIGYRAWPARLEMLAG